MSDKKGEAPVINNNNNNNNDNNKIIEGKIEGGKIQRLKASACAVSAVTVYNDRAEISREVEAFLSEEGTHTIVVYDLSPDVDQDSIRIQGGEGNATILEVSHQEIFGDREELDQTTIMIRKMESIRLEKQKLGSKSANSQKERAWLDGFAQTIKNGPSNPSTSPLSSGNIKVDEFLSNSSAFLSYYSEQTSRLDNQDLEIALKLKELTGEENLLKKKVVQLQQDHLVDFRREVSVVVSAPSSTKIKMQLTYIIMNAHWTPSYDARMTSESEDLELSYFGSITNASGEDWNNVKLFLSTAAPSVGGAPPPLRFMKVEIDYGQRQQQVRNYDAKRKVDTTTQHVIDKITSNINNQNLMLDDLLEQTEQLQTEAKQVWTTSRQKNIAHQKFTPHATGSMTVMTAYAETSHVGASSATFEIPRRSTIVSDNKPHKVTITVIRLKAKLSHYATPDTSGHVYLKASAINTTEQYPFLTGPMNVFMNANFIAKSELPDVSPQEKFSVYLGTDLGVRLEVKPVRRVKEKQTGIINKTNIESFRHLSIVKNTRKAPINISVLCQVPASTDERIKVKLLHPDVKQESAVKFVDYKLLKWKLVIPAGQSKELHYHYNVEWPASINIVHMATI